MHMLNNLLTSTPKSAFRVFHLLQTCMLASSPPSITTPSEWRNALETLPSTPNTIPAFFFGHGSPALAFPVGEVRAGLGAYPGPTGPLANFLKDFGPALLKKYEPKGIIVFSAHWETRGERLGTYITHLKPWRIPF